MGIIKKNMEDTGVFFKFLYNEEEINYPKSVMNLIEKSFYDIMRKKIIH